MPAAQHDVRINMEKLRGLILVGSTVFGGVAGYMIVVSNGMALNDKVGGIATYSAITIGVVAGMFIGGICLLFLRR
jgi:hypothetical protein